METFSALLAICAGNSPVPGEFPAQRPVTQSFDIFFDLRLNNGWVNNPEAGDLRRYCAHYDIIVMMESEILINIGSDNGLISGDMITWSNATLLSIGYYWTNFSEI